MKVDKQGRLKLSEAQIQKACIELLRAEGWVVRPAPRDGRKAIRGAFSVPAGEPDLLCVKWYARGWKVLLLECKTLTGKLSDTQHEWADEHLGWGFIVRSVEEVKAFLELTKET